MKKTLIIFTLISLFTSALFAQSTDAEKLLKQAEDNTGFFDTDFTGNYTVVQEKPGEGQNLTEAIIYRRDKIGSWTILVTGPAKEKGKGYLQIDGNIWFFDPADRRFTFTSAKDKFQNTNANNSDFAPQRYYSDYTITKTAQTKLGNFECTVFDLESKDGVTVDYPILKVWVSNADGLIRMKEDYSLSGQKLRTTAIPSYQSVKDNGTTYSVPVKMLITDNLRGKKISGKVQYEKTQITINNVSFKKQSDMVFTKPYLETMSQK